MFLFPFLNQHFDKKQQCTHEGNVDRRKTGQVRLRNTLTMSMVTHGLHVHQHADIYQKSVT